MADLSTDTAGIHSPNPFWIASGPPGNSLRQVRLAFEAGWGGVVWKTVGAPVIDTAMREDPWKPVSNNVFEGEANEMLAFARARIAFVKCELERGAGNAACRQ